MKSSLSRTFKDLSEDKDSKDRIYKDRITKRVITDENNADFANESIFVIESFVPTYESQRISTLLVNKELKDELGIPADCYSFTNWFDLVSLIPTPKFETICGN